MPWIILILVGLLLGFFDLQTGLKSRSQRPVRIFGRAWYRAAPLAILRFTCDIAIGVVTYLLISPGAQLKTLEQNLGASNVQSIKALFAALLGSTLLRSQVLIGGANVRPVSVIKPFQRFRTWADTEIAQVCVIAITSWKDNRILPTIMAMPIQDVEKKALDWLSFQFRGAKLAERQAFVSSTLRAPLPTEKEKRDALDAIVNMLIDVPGGRRFIAELRRAGRKQRRQA